MTRRPYRPRHSNPSKTEVYERIDANCKDCFYNKEEPGTWRQQIERCEITFCELWAIRPVSANYEPPPDRTENTKGSAL